MHDGRKQSGSRRLRERKKVSKFVNRYFREENEDEEYKKIEYGTIRKYMLFRGWLHERFSVAISCPICCKSQMRFTVPAIRCLTRITFYIFFALNRRCDLVYLRFGVQIRVCFAAVPRVNLNKKGTEFIESI
jgi:hypothetical protein